MLHIKTQYLMGSSNKPVNMLSCILWLWGELSNIFAYNRVELGLERAKPDFGTHQH